MKQTFIAAMKQNLVLAGLLFGAAFMFGAGATVPQFRIPVALPGDTALKTVTVVIDPPLTATRDTAGLIHLGSAVQPSLCSTDGSGNTLCQFIHGDDLRQAPIAMSYDETPLYDPTTMQWTLAHQPLSSLGTACWLNGTLQQQGIDYSFGIIVASATNAPFVLISMVWQPTDPVRCQYAYAVPTPAAVR